MIQFLDSCSNSFLPKSILDCNTVNKVNNELYRIMETTDTQKGSFFKDDMEWAARYLTIYNISMERAKDIIRDIVNALSTVSWKQFPEYKRQEIFRNRLHSVISTLKQSNHNIY